MIRRLFSDPIAAAFIRRLAPIAAGLPDGQLWPIALAGADAPAYVIVQVARREQHQHRHATGDQLAHALQLVTLSHITGPRP